MLKDDAVLASLVVSLNRREESCHWCEPFPVRDPQGGGGNSGLQGPAGVSGQGLARVGPDALLCLILSCRGAARNQIFM